MTEFPPPFSLELLFVHDVIGRALRVRQRGPFLPFVTHARLQQEITHDEVAFGPAADRFVVQEKVRFTRKRCLACTAVLPEKTSKLLRLGLLAGQIAHRATGGPDSCYIAVDQTAVVNEEATLSLWLNLCDPSLISTAMMSR